MEKINDYLPQSVNGKYALITGGTTGIGRATALLLAAQGAHVMIFGLNGQHLEDALADIKKEAKGRVHGFVADTASEEGIAQIFREVAAEFGTLDILVNNAALGYGSITEGRYADWQYIVNTNLLGYMACIHEVINYMKPKGAGHIVNIGSMSADVREETGSVYVATKSGIQGFSAALRKQVNQYGIKVTLIEPGAVDTDMQVKPTPEKLEKVQSLEMLTADDIAMSVLYCLCQPQRCDVVELKIRPLLQKI